MYENLYSARRMHEGSRVIRVAAAWTCDQGDSCLDVWSGWQLPGRVISVTAAWTCGQGGSCLDVWSV
eukprot:366464-Chlamydomonas_euryale.AAC.12